MQVCIIGAGVIGLTTAYALAREGHQVTVIDRQPGVARETSYANGAQLSYSYVSPLAGAGVIPKIPRWLLAKDSPLRFRPRLDPQQWRWCLSFLASCRAQRNRQSTLDLLHLAYLSRDLVGALAAREGLDFDHLQTGKLVVYRDPASLAGAESLVAFLAQHGAEQELLDGPACIAREPALADLGQRLVGGVYTASDDTGDCYRFCQELERVLRAPPYAVRFLFDTRIEALIARRGRIDVARTNHGDIPAEQFIIAAGNGSRALLRGVGASLPLYPLKGYSLTVPVRAEHRAPRISVTDYDRRTVYAPVGRSLRVAALVDIEGHDTTIDNRRVDALLAQVRRDLPRCGDLDRAEPWAGLRPATPGGRPIIGPVGPGNLLVNVGHGALGFTLACGSAQLIADLLAGRPPSVALAPFSAQT